MKTNLKITGMELKTSKAGRDYYSFKTTEGQMSCFEDNVVKELKEAHHTEQDISVEFETRGDKGQFKNITKYYGKATDVVPEEKVHSKPVKDQYVEARASKDACMHTSYAKDTYNNEVAGLIIQFGRKLTCDERTETMKEAIRVIKMAREGLK